MREDAKLKYLASVIATLVMTTSKDKPLPSFDEIRNISLTWEMQSFCALMRLRTEKGLSREWIRALKSELEVRVDFCLEVLNHPRRFSFDIIDELEVTARVSSPGGRDFSIVITTGLVVALMLGALAIVDKDVGVVSREMFPNDWRGLPTRHECEKNWTPLIASYEESVLNHALPDDSWRIVLAHSILGRSLDYVIFHEVSHALRGHLDFLLKNSTNDFVQMSEITSAEPSRLSNQLSQLMESRADDGATIHATGKWRLIASKHVWSEGPLPFGLCGFPLFNQEDLLNCLTHSIALVFFVLGNREITIPSDKSKYPSIEYRFWRFLKLSGIANDVNIDWKNTLIELSRCLKAKGLLHIDKIAPWASENEQSMLEYDKWLSAVDIEIFPFEQAWIAANLHVGKPPKMPRRIWRWKFPRSK